MPRKVRIGGSWVETDSGIVIPVADEDAIEAAIVALAPHTYLRCTGDTPFTNFGSSAKVWSSGHWAHWPGPTFDRAYGPTLRGNTHRLVEASNTATGGTSHTWMAWVYVTEEGTANEQAVIMNHGLNSGAFSGRSWAFAIASKNHATTPKALFAEGFQSGSVYNYTATGSVVPYDEWVHLAITWGPGVQIAYINGVETGARGTQNRNLNVGTQPMNIASLHDANMAFPGAVAHPAYWQSVLTPEQILSVVDAAGLPAAA